MSATLSAVLPAEIRGERTYKTNPLVSVVIPTLNEAANLPHVLPRIPSFVHEIIIVDGGSVDDTVAIARQLCDVRIVDQEHHGKGEALALGFAHATGDIIVMMDADGSTDPAEIPLFIKPLVDEGVDFVKGSRFMTGGSTTDMTPIRRAGNGFLRGLVNVLFDTEYTDLCYGYNAFWAHCLPYMNLNCRGFEVETQINTRIARAGLTVREVPSVEHERIHGESHLRATRDGLRVLRTILAERFAGPSALIDVP